jgi:hypothetical protein
MLANTEPIAGFPPGWSPAKEIGHLGDLEPLWLRRVRDLLEGRAELTAADLQNRATHEADHDAWSLPQLVDRFEPARRALVEALRGASPADLERSARHPRLGTPMRIIDLAYFVAEHDDHHIARLRDLLHIAPAQSAADFDPDVCRGPRQGDRLTSFHVARPGSS